MEMHALDAIAVTIRGTPPLPPSVIDLLVLLYPKEIRALVIRQDVSYRAEGDGCIECDDPALLYAAAWDLGGN
ncbi:MAG: hypothetical protein APR53_00025 [Methanoculleus sp. SDB]|nr:MAG: hypothetical protein APR53_00025 [Methanoculleus sp. SDB]